MPHLLEDLRALPGRNPPASQADLDMLAEGLGYEPPSSVALLYRDHAGIKDGHRLPLRFLPPAEAVSTNSELRASWLRLDPSIAVFWTDDHSNYAGVFVDGDLSGRVCLIDHEEPVDWPRYRSVDSLCHRIVEAWRHGQDWYEMPTDYPAVVAALDPLVGQDRLLARGYLARYAENPEDEHCQHLAFHALHLLPPDDTTLLLPLLQSSDMWLQARACEVLGLRRFAAAAEDLHAVALHGAGNGKIAAILALKRINNRDSSRLLRDLRRVLGDRFDPYFR